MLLESDSKAIIFKPHTPESERARESEQIYYYNQGDHKRKE